MQRIDIEQNSDIWFEFRKGRIGGSKSKGLIPLSRGRMKGVIEGTAGFWKLLAEKMAIPKDGEDERERGHRLQEIGIEKTNATFGTNFSEGGVWQSEENIYVSPDGDDPDDLTRAVEVKAFDPDRHLRIIWEDLQQRKKEYRAFDSIPSDHQSQVLQYFLVNPDLKTLFWVLVSELTAHEKLSFYPIVVERETILEEIKAQMQVEHDVLRRTQEIIAELLTTNLREERKSERN